MTPATYEVKSTMDSRALLALAAAALAPSYQFADDTEYAGLLYAPMLTGVVAVAAPISKVTLVDEPPQQDHRDYEFEPPLLFDGSIQLSGTVTAELPAVDWDY